MTNTETTPNRYSTALMAAACLMAATPSCNNSSHILLYQQSNLGLNAGINPATQNLHVRIGLRRQFGAIVPKYSTGNTKDEPKAASAYFGSRARVTGPFRVPEVAEVMATGRAATIAAQGANALDFVTEQETPPPPLPVVDDEEPIEPVIEEP